MGVRGGREHALCYDLAQAKPGSFAWRKCVRKVPEMDTQIQCAMDEVEEKDGLYIGRWRRPVNTAIDIKGSIHDDTAAQDLGLRGGTVAGSIHMELFPPLLLKAFGQRWFDQGNLSLYFLDPTTDREEVRAVIAVPSSGASDVQVNVWMERPSGVRICEGTAAVGDPDEPSALLARDLNRFPPGELRILAPVAAGDPFPETEVRVTPEMQDKRVKATTDPLPWYTSDSPWGGLLATIVNVVDIIHQPFYAYIRQLEGTSAVGLFGAIEVRNINGPVLVDVPYRAGGHIVNLGQTPRTEYVWFET
jgi:hypothetical protein